MSTVPAASRELARATRGGGRLGPALPDGRQSGRGTSPPRRTRLSALVIVASLSVHAAAFGLLCLIPPRPRHRLQTVEMITVRRPKPPPSKPPPPPKPLPPPPPPPRVVPRLVTRAPRTPPPPPPPATPPAPPPSFGVASFNLSDSDSPDGVAVPVGDSLAVDPSNVGPAHPGRRTQAPVAVTAGPAGPAVYVAPPVHIVSFPKKLRDAPQLDCPAFAAGQLVPPQEVDFSLTIDSDGRISSIVLTKGIGHGCDQIARRAVSQLAFSPAMGSDGKPMRKKIHYEYDFEPAE